MKGAEFVVFWADGTQQKSAAAIDYSDISEVAAEDEQDEPIKTEGQIQPHQIQP